mmetsp:Transcript_7591/g.17981  ORF Transcript_7591/g.17981 Transcript_7591/m.17981 type:complete len:234 (+) Transcript_7591:2209-2910(+)
MAGAFEALRADILVRLTLPVPIAAPGLSGSSSGSGHESSASQALRSGRMAFCTDMAKAPPLICLGGSPGTEFAAMAAATEASRFFIAAAAAAASSADCGGASPSSPSAVLAEAPRESARLDTEPSRASLSGTPSPRLLNMSVSAAAAADAAPSASPASVSLPLSSVASKLSRSAIAAASAAGSGKPGGGDGGGGMGGGGDGLGAAGGCGGSGKTLSLIRSLGLNLPTVTSSRR